MIVFSRTLVLVAALLLASACRGSDAGSGPPTERLTSPPPTLGRNAPPPASLETEGGHFWLGYSTYCWGGTCADYVEPSCDDVERVPTIIVGRGEAVTAHLGFDPEELILRFLTGERRPTKDDEQTLAPSRSPSWRVERDGAFLLFATTDGGDASYVACARFPD